MIVYIMKQAFFELTYLFVRKYFQNGRYFSLEPGCRKVWGNSNICLLIKRKADKMRLDIANYVGYNQASYICFEI